MLAAIYRDIALINDQDMYGTCRTIESLPTNVRFRMLRVGKLYLTNGKSSIIAKLDGTSHIFGDLKDGRDFNIVLTNLFQDSSKQDALVRITSQDALGWMSMRVTKRPPDYYTTVIEFEFHERLY